MPQDGTSQTPDALPSVVSEAKAENVSGSRLKAKRYVASDGASQFRGWYDSGKKVDCQILPTCGGGLRCIPGVAVAMGLYYMDTGCTKPAAMATGVTYVVSPEGTPSCWRGYNASAVQKGFQKVGGTCTQVAGSFVQIDTELPYGDYVSAEEKTD